MGDDTRAEAGDGVGTECLGDDLAVSERIQHRSVCG